MCKPIMNTSDEASLPLFTDFRSALNRKVEVENCDLNIISECIADKTLFYELEETVDWIKEHKFENIALQFPDYLLHDSDWISRAIEDKVGKKPYILADTSYGSCCVDTVASQHAYANCVIHYGDACLSAPPENLPVRYIFGKQRVDFVRLRACFESLKLSIESNFYCLLYHTSFTHCSDELFANLLPIFGGDHLFHCEIASKSTKISVQYSDSVTLGRLIPIDLESKVKFTTIYIGDDSTALLPLWLMTYPNCTTVLHFDPHRQYLFTNHPISTPRLRRRLYLIERIKDAKTIGIVCGTLSVFGHAKIVDRLRRLIRNACKKVYVFSVGKLNVPKLSNFSADVDVFVLVSCAFGTLLDTCDYYKPVVTVFEAEVALNPEHKWYAQSGWTVEFAKFISTPMSQKSQPDTDLSLITGRIRRVGIDESRKSDDNLELQLYTAGDYFKNRSWKGMQEIFEPQSTELASTGRSGIPSGYSTEPRI